MGYAIVFSSRTGNTRQLAEAIRDALPADGCVYFGQPGPDVPAADRYYVGFLSPSPFAYLYLMYILYDTYVHNTIDIIYKVMYISLYIFVMYII